MGRKGKLLKENYNPKMKQKGSQPLHMDVNKRRSRGEGPGRWISTGLLLYKPEDLSSNPQHPHKKPGMDAYAYNISIERGRDE